MTKRERLTDIDRAKGLGIVLVVFGHLAAKTLPEGNAWFGYAQTAVYQFHMPFFMYLSGYVYFFTGAHRIDLGDWPSVALRRAERLLVPFIGFGLILTVGKALGRGFMHVDHPPESAVEALSGLFWDTDRSPAISVWYIWVLFVYTLLTPILFSLYGRRLPLLLAAAVVMCTLPIPHVMFLNRVFLYYVFFVLGGICAAGGDRWLGFVDRYWGITACAFVAAVSIAVWYFEDLPGTARLLACGSLSMPVLHGIVRTGVMSRWSLLLLCGQLSFVIYLFNTPFIGVTKGLMLHALPWDGANCLLYLPVLMAAGVFGPVLLKRYVIRYFPYLDRLTN